MVLWLSSCFYSVGARKFEVKKVTTHKKRGWHKKRGCDKIDFSIEPENSNSLKVFRKFADEFGIEMRQIDTLTYRKYPEDDPVVEYFYQYVL